MQASTMTPEQAERYARQATEIVASRFEAAVRYAEAYGHEGRAIVIDGSQYSPSTRAVPYASIVWDSDSAEAWEAFEDYLDRAVDGMIVPEDTDSESPDDWTLSWDDGCLFAVAPELPEN
jgi:hypothetical protein